MTIPYKEPELTTFQKAVVSILMVSVVGSFLCIYNYGCKRESKLVDMQCTYEIYRNGIHMTDKTFTVKTKFDRCPEERFEGICKSESINCLLKEKL